MFSNEFNNKFNEFNTEYGEIHTSSTEKSTRTRTPRTVRAVAVSALALTLSAGLAAGSAGAATTSAWPEPRMTIEGLPPLTMNFDSGRYPNQPTAGGQFCDGDWVSKAARPIDGQQWGFAEEDSNRLDQYSVTVILTEWKNSAREQRHLRADTGFCRFSLDDLRVTKSTMTTFAAQGDGRAVITQRKGDRILAVTVDSPVSSRDAAHLAKWVLKDNRAMLKG